MTSMTQRIAAMHYVADAKQVEALAHELYASQSNVRSADGTYLKILIVAVQGALDPKRRKDARVQRKALEEINEPFYAAVLRGITSVDIAPDPTLEKNEQARRAIERNRRSTFARSSKSTLAAFIMGGGDVRTLDVMTASKGALRAAVDKGRGAAALLALTVERSSGAILRVVSTEAATNPEAARTRLEGVIEQLQAALDDMPDAGRQRKPTTKPAVVAMNGFQRHRVYPAPAMQMSA